MDGGPQKNFCRHFCTTAAAGWHR